MTGPSEGNFLPLAGEPNPFVECPGGHPWQSELPLDRFNSERELADRVLARLDPWFVVDREVHGVHCSGRRMRLDAMLRPRNPGEWRNPDVAFGVEFKIPDREDNYNVTAWFAQSVDYTHVDWAGYGRRIILTCPSVVPCPGQPGSGFHEEHLRGIYPNLAGQFGVGELVLLWGYGLTIRVSTRRVWSERGGVRVGRHSWLNVRSGNR
ncbi:MAG TPA: hypothetical protein VIS06_12675 [Mycobacteriales bacterium]